MYNINDTVVSRYSTPRRYTSAALGIVMTTPNATDRKGGRAWLDKTWTVLILGGAGRERVQNCKSSLATTVGGQTEKRPAQQSLLHKITQLQVN